MKHVKRVSVKKGLAALPAKADILPPPRPWWKKE